MFEKKSGSDNTSVNPRRGVCGSERSESGEQHTEFLKDGLDKKHDKKRSGTAPEPGSKELFKYIESDDFTASV